MKKVLGSIAILFLLVTASFAQYTTISASNIGDGSGALLAKGQICFTGTDGAGNAISYRIGGGGQVMTKPVCQSVVNGVIVGGVQVADTSLTSPANICQRAYVKDLASNQVVIGSDHAGTHTGYECLQPTGPTFSFDSYVPAISGFLALVPPTVSGNLTVIGTITASGNITAANIPSKVLWAEFFSGADMCAKIASAISTLPSTGGTIDARGFQGAQSCSSNPFSGVGTKPIQVVIGAATVTSTVTWTIPSNFSLIGQAQSVSTLKFTSTAAGLNASGSSNFRISSLKIDTTGTSSQYAILTDASSAKQVIDNVSVLGAATNAVANGELYLQGSDISVRNSTFDTITFVFCYQCAGGDIENNAFYNTRTGIYLRDSGGSTDRFMSVRGNRFLSAAGAALNGLDSILIESSRNVSVVANVTKAANEHCIYVSDGTNGSADITITGNTCAGWGAGAGIQVRGNFVSSGAYNQNIIVTGNNVEGTAIANTFGFLFIGNRNLTVTTNTATRANLDGFYFDNIIGANIGTNVASRNGASGFRFADDQNIGPSSGLNIGLNTSVNNNLNGNGFTAFQVAMGHAFANKQFHFVGNSGSNTLPVVAISSITRASNVVTVTTSVPHFLASGIYSRLIISGVSDASFNTTLSDGGTRLTINVIDDTHYTYPQTAANATSSGGTIEAKSQVYAFSSAISGGASLDLLTFNDNNGDNLVGATYSGTLSATACGITDLVGGTFNVKSCSTGSTVASIDSTGKVTASGFVGTGPAKLASGSASNTDINGILTLAAGTASYTFVNTYSSTPICFSKDVTTSTNATNETVTTTTLTVTGTGTDQVKYSCTGRN